MNELKDKIDNRRANVMVVGLGYVGVPLAMNIAAKGFNTIGLDISENRVDDLKQGISPFASIDNQKIITFSERPNVSLTTDFKKINNADVLIICLPTPLDKHHQPDLSIIESFLSIAVENISANTLISLESTTWPGTTEEIIVPVFDSNKFQVGKDIFIGYSPEREDPGNPMELDQIPKVVGGHTHSCKELMSKFYSSIFDSIHLVKDCKTAELTKLVENIQRMVNISLVNDLKVISSKMGINIFEVIDAASTKPFGFTPYYPGPGLGGHCIPIDPFYLTWKAREFGLHTRFIELSGEINMNIRNYVINGIGSELNNIGKSFKDSKILILGVAYKKNVNDVRESPALYILNELLCKGADVKYHDKFVPDLDLGIDNFKALSSVNLNKEIIRDSDIVLILTNHDYIDYELISKNAEIIVDTRGVSELRGLDKTKIY